MSGTPLITLTTDFGEGSSYVAQMKAAVLSINPAVRLLDISHSVAPQDVYAASLVIAETCPLFPKGSIHLTVVDPGVGSERRMLAAQIGSSLYVGPDNGLLHFVAEQQGRGATVALDRQEYWRPEVSSTFHGRDIMGPVAAHLSLGVKLDEIGSPLSQIVGLQRDAPQWSKDRIVGRIARVDTFGNLISDISSQPLSVAAGSGRSLLVHIAGTKIEGLVQTYSERPVGSVVTLVGSSGWLEIAVVNGHAGNALRVGVGERVEVTLGS